MRDIKKSRLRETLYNNSFDHLLVIGRANIVFLVDNFEISIVKVSSESPTEFVCLFV